VSSVCRRRQLPLPPHRYSRSVAQREKSRQNVFLAAPEMRTTADDRSASRTDPSLGAQTSLTWIQVVTRGVMHSGVCLRESVIVIVIAIASVTVTLTLIGSSIENSRETQTSAWRCRDPTLSPIGQ
jgi:hypothetical protein